MKRRDVIKLGAVAAGAGVLPSCAVPKMLGSMQGADGAAAFNAVLDEQLGKLDLRFRVEDVRHGNECVRLPRDGLREAGIRMAE